MYGIINEKVIEIINLSSDAINLDVSIKSRRSRSAKNQQGRLFRNEIRPLVARFALNKRLKQYNTKYILVHVWDDKISVYNESVDEFISYSDAKIFDRLQQILIQEFTKWTQP